MQRRTLSRRLEWPPAHAAHAHVAANAATTARLGARLPGVGRTDAVHQCFDEPALDATSRLGHTWWRHAFLVEWTRSGAAAHVGGGTMRVLAFFLALLAAP